MKFIQEKNRDTILAEHVSAMKSSKNKFVIDLFNDGLVGKNLN